MSEKQLKGNTPIFRALFNTTVKMMGGELKDGPAKAQNSYGEHTELVEVGG